MSTSVAIAGSNNSRYIDFWLLTAALMLLALGLMMVFSSSGVMAETTFGDAYYFFKRQMVFTVLGLGLMVAAAYVPKRIIYNFKYLWLLIAFIALIVVISPLSPTINGAKRWIFVAGFSLQPMEFAKIALVIYLAYFFSTKQELVKTFSVGVIPPFAVTGAMALLLLAQPDFGGAALMVMILFLMCLAGGTRLIYLLLSLGLAVGGAWLLVSSSPYRLNRLLGFMDPFKDAQGTGYQLVQSLYALASGHLWGAGLGAGKQKLFFLPEAHNDFIAAVIGEELGFAGISVLFLLIGILLWRGFAVALKQGDLRDRLTSYGLTLILCLGALLNLAVVLGAVPPKGVPLPFLSYGGSSMLCSLLCIGLLLNFSRNAQPQPKAGT